jgi:HEAT repeat protein
VAVRLLLAILGVSAAAAGGLAADPVPTVPQDKLIDRLIDGLKDPDPDVRQHLAVALAKIGPAGVEPLIAALGDTSAEKRAGAAYALGQIGPPARGALPKLLDALDDKDLDVRRQASYAISRLVPTGTVKPTQPPVGGK